MDHGSITPLKPRSRWNRGIMIACMLFEVIVIVFCVLGFLHSYETPEGGGARTIYGIVGIAFALAVVGQGLSLAGVQIRRK